MPFPVAFLDIGNTLGVPQLNGGALERIKLFPFVPEILTRLKARCRLGILSNTGDETLANMQRVLSDAGISPFFENALQLFSSVEGIDKTKVEFFERAVGRSGIAAARCIYVSEDADERAMAGRAGMQPSFHVLHVF